MLYRNWFNLHQIENISLEKRWNILPFNRETVLHLQEVLKVNETICKLLDQRGVKTFEEARSFFRPSLDELHSPWLMKDMQKAVDRIKAAKEKGEKVLIYGDYDVDGTTAVASMFLFLENIFPSEQLEFYIPHRYREGYGVSKIGIDYAHENNFDLIISLDCGIKSVDLISYANSLGMDFIICDHHLPDVIVPEAVAILNPKQTDCNYPFKELCGCGVGFKLICALTETFELPASLPLESLDLNAIAIAADIVPIVGENRILAYHGLQKINSNPSQGIKAILDKAEVKLPLSITNVVFIIAPRINAAGRMDDAKKAVQLFMEKDPTTAAVLAGLLQTDNTERKEADSTITQEALEMIQADAALTNRNTTVVYAEHWHKGVVGIVASRLIENYYRPTVVLTRSGDVVAGSARSVPGFNLYEAIHACRHHLVAYGGHFAAAGLSMLPENVQQFQVAFEQIVSQTIDPRLLTQEIIIDAEVKPADVTYSLYKLVSQMEPFGPGNMRPIFMLRDVVAHSYIVLREKHLRINVSLNGTILSCIGFNLFEMEDLVKDKKTFNMAFSLDENTWNGNTSLQLKIIDIRSNES